jgi:hypothetical protein
VEVAIWWVQVEPLVIQTVKRKQVKERERK